MRNPRTCPHCGSLIVCWNWFGPIGSNSLEGPSPYWDHECWNCEVIFSTFYKVKDGVPYEALATLQELQDKQEEPVKWNKTLEVLYGIKDV